MTTIRIANKDMTYSSHEAFAMASMGYGWEDISLRTGISRGDTKRLVLSVENARLERLAKQIVRLV